MITFGSLKERVLGHIENNVALPGKYEAYRTHYPRRLYKPKM